MSYFESSMTSSKHIVLPLLLACFLLLNCMTLWLVRDFTSACTNYRPVHENSPPRLNTDNATNAQILSTTLQSPTQENGSETFYLAKDLFDDVENDFERCQFVNRLKDDVLVESDGIVQTLGQFRTLKAKEFVKQTAIPFKDQRIFNIRDFKPKDKPEGYLNKSTEHLDENVVAKQLSDNEQMRYKTGDKDPTLIPEVQEEIKKAKEEDRVPNIVHFVYFGKFSMNINTYIAFIGTLRFLKPQVILLHFDKEPEETPFWKAFIAQAGSIVKLVKRTAPLTVWGIKIKFVEHKADVARLQIMLQIGGIYLDVDSVPLRPIDDLMKNNITMGEDSVFSIANGVIIAKRDSWFLKRWYWEYSYFNGKKWGHNSVIVPWALSRVFPDTINVIRNKICRPNWYEIIHFYKGIVNLDQVYITHLYTRYIAKHDAKPVRPLKDFAVLRTAYGEVARRTIWGKKDVRDVRNLLVTCNITDTLIKETGLLPT